MKKKKVLFATLLMIFASAILMPNVYAEDFSCTVFGDEVLIDTQFAKITSTIILGIQVVVPIVLIVWGMMDLAKAVMAQKEDEIKKGQQTFIKRLIAAAIVFFVVAVVKLVINFVSTDSEDILACVDCFISGSCE